MHAHTQAHMHTYVKRTRKQAYQCTNVPRVQNLIDEHKDSQENQYVKKRSIL